MLTPKDNSAISFSRRSRSWLRRFLDRILPPRWVLDLWILEGWLTILRRPPGTVVSMTLTDDDDGLFRVTGRFRNPGPTTLPFGSGVTVEEALRSTDYVVSSLALHDILVPERGHFEMLFGTEQHLQDELLRTLPAMRRAIQYQMQEAMRLASASLEDEERN